MSMSITTTRNADPIPEKAMEWLGEAGTYLYARHKRSGQEYAVMRSPMSAEEYVLLPGELFITRKRVEILSDGAEWPVTAHHLAMPVPEGTWQKLAERPKRQEAERPLRAWSALADLFVPKRDKPPMVLGPVPSDPGLGAMQAATGIGGPMMIEVKPNTLEASPAGYLAYFTGKGAELSRGKRDGGRLIARSRVRLSDLDRALLRAVAPLIVMELGGPEVLCTECKARAVEPIEPNAWACREHAQ